LKLFESPKCFLQLLSTYSRGTTKGGRDVEGILPKVHLLELVILAGVKSLVVLIFKHMYALLS
jgi:hypothetical protein